MKKVMFFMAVAGMMFAFAACNNKTAEEPVDSTAIEQTEAPVQEAPVAADTTAVEAPAEATTNAQ